MTKENLSPIRSLTPTEVTIELMRLCAEAGTVERRMLLISARGDDLGVTDDRQALSTLTELIAAMPDEERRVQLTVARRWVALGMRTYGRLDLNAENRNFSVEALEEDIDASFYRIAAQLHGRPDGLLDRSIETMRRAITSLLKKEQL